MGGGGVDLWGVRFGECLRAANTPSGESTGAAAVAARQAPLCASLDPDRAPVASYVVPALLIFASVVLGRLLVLPGVGLSFAWMSVGFAFLFSLGHQSCESARSAGRISAWVLTLLFSQAAGHAVASTLWPDDEVAPLALVLWTVGDSVQALFGACLFKRLRRGRSPWGMGTLRTSVDLLAAAVASSLVAAAAVAVIVVGFDTFPWGAVPFVLLRNALVVYGLAGCIILFSAPPDPDDVPRRDWRLTIAVCSGLTGDLLFVLSSGPHYTFAFVVVPVVMWAASVLSVRQTSVFLQIVTLPVVAASMVGAGPLATGRPGIRVATTYGLVLFVCVMAMMISLGTLERRRLVARVRAHAQQSSEQARLLGTILDALPEAVVVVDAQGKVARENVASRYLWDAGPRLVDLSGSTGQRPVRTALAGVDASGVDVVVQARRAVPAAVSSVLLDARAGGSADRVLSVQAYPLRLRDDPAAVVIARDVTEQRRRADELRSFARVVAHDLFNPLAASELWRETLHEELEGVRPGLGAVALGELAAANDRMRVFITDLLHYNVARDGALEREDIALDELIADVVTDRLSAIPPADRPDVGVDVQGWVRGDRLLLRQVFVNLLENAYKYRRPGDRGRIRIWVQTPHRAWIVVHVDDDGIGIPAGNERLIFQEFYRAENCTSVRGSGLGLAICERIVERHGGRVEARARGERGSRFTVWLPRLSVEEAAPAGASGDGRLLAEATTRMTRPATECAQPESATPWPASVAAGPGGGAALP